jgi:NADPH-dependent glutamate synthase beta subunit-like oxidoreductase
MDKPLVGILAAFALLVSAAPSQATMKIQKEAKAATYPATNCLYCHNEKIPVKGKVVTHNERGTFLVKVKEEKKAKEVDVAWLKDFVETKK